MAAKPLPSAELLRQLLDYDPETGLLTWRPRTSRHWNSRYAGNVAGGRHRCGYTAIGIHGITYLAHRLVWAIHYGEEPKGEIDHINGINADNRIANLRDVVHIDNLRNAKRSSANKSGVTGVFWNKGSRRWRSSIRRDGVNIDLGCYDTLNEAGAARRGAEKALGFHKNHGKR